MSKKDLEKLSVLYIENVAMINSGLDEDRIYSVFLKILNGKQLPIYFIGDKDDEEFKFGDFIEELTEPNQIITVEQIKNICKAFINDTLEMRGGSEKYISQFTNFINDRILDEINLSKRSV